MGKLSDIGEVLSRREMKQVMAGSGSDYPTCETDNDCTLRCRKCESWWDCFCSSCCLASC